MMPFEQLSIKESRIVNVTPEIARSMLLNNESNRPISKGIVKDYARDMSNGDWRLTHQGIAINSRGSIVDGQHRLYAIIESGIPVRMLVTTYSSECSALRTPIDLQRRRKTSDIIGIDTSTCEAVGFIIKELYKNRIRLDTAIMDFVQNNKKAIDWYESHIPKTSRRVLTTAPVRSAILVAYISGSDWSEQYDALHSDKFESMNPSTVRLYRKLLSYDNTGFAFRHEAFGCVYMVASNPNAVIKMFKTSAIDEAYEMARSVIDKVWDSK